MNKIPFLLLFLLFLSCQEKQPGLWEDFPTSSKVEELAKLPKSIKESSGLVYWQQGLWTLNDGGNGAYIYQVGINKKDKKKELKIGGVKNTDWESLAQDSSYFYLGDFGNNNGHRTDLAIHLVPKTELLMSDKKTPSSGSITFSYQDQDLENTPRRGHNYDCEAMLVMEDSIYLFSKNHGDKQCTIYRLPKAIGAQVAVPVAHFDTKGKITGAAWDKGQNRIALLGYNQSSRGHRPFVWVFSEYTEHDFFSGKAKRVNLPFFLQTEGICHFQGDQFFLTNEFEDGKKGKVFLWEMEN